MANRFVAGEGDMFMVFNRDLICATCAYRRGELDDPKMVLACDMFEAIKPVKVLQGETCDLYMEVD